MGEAKGEGAGERVLTSPTSMVGLKLRIWGT